LTCEGIGGVAVSLRRLLNHVDNGMVVKLLLR
jgi:hypothetical protein